MPDAPAEERGPDAAPVMVFAEPKRRRRGGWLLGVAAVAALAVAAVLIVVQAQRGADDGAPPAGTPTPPASPVGTPTATSTPAPTTTAATPRPSATTAPTAAPTDPPVQETSSPVQTDAPPVEPPAVEPPSAEAFRGAVGPRLDDALTGVRMLGKLSGSEAVTVVDQLTQDAMVLSDTVAPASVGADWVDATAAYIGRLNALREAYAKGGDAKAALAGVQQGAEALRSLAGL